MNNTANEKLATAAPKKKRRIASLDKKKARAGYIFVLPFIIGLVAMYLPIIYDQSPSVDREKDFTLSLSSFPSAVISQ